MNLNLSDYCNKKVQCSCGKVHYCPIHDVVVGNGALEKIPELFRDYQSIYMVADQNTYAVCGEYVFSLLEGKIISKHIYERSGRLIPNEEAIEELKGKMPEETDLVLGIGSGVINDLCKYVTWNMGIECAIVATAPSMDGYASSGAAMITKGMKVTYTTHPPKYIVADIDYIKHAPMNMIQSGYGDIIGKYSSLNDWKLSNLINGEYLCSEIYQLVYAVTNDIRDSVEEIKNRQDFAIEKLMKALILIGITLSYVGSTRPGSGSEHHLSHFFEVVGLVKREPHFVHGTDVAYATVLTAGMRERICAVDTPKFYIEKENEREREWNRIFGPISDEVKQLQKSANSYNNHLNEVYLKLWTEIKAILKECPSEKECRHMIEAVGFDMTEFEKMYGAEKIRDAMFYGKDLKDRYSVLWIYYFLFVTDKNMS